MLKYGYIYKYLSIMANLMKIRDAKPRAYGKAMAAGLPKKVGYGNGELPHHFVHFSIQQKSAFFIWWIFLFGGDTTIKPFINFHLYKEKANDSQCGKIGPKRSRR